MPGEFTKLDAVNEILEESGFKSVSALSPTGPGNAKVAERVLDRALRKILVTGWWFNYQECVVMEPNTQGEIIPPANALSLDGLGDDIIQIQGKLYSKANQTSVFENSVSVTVIYFYEFDEVPFEAQDYAVKMATRKFQHSRVGDNAALQQHRIDEADARATLRHKEGQYGGQNMRLNPSLHYAHRTPRVGIYSDL